MCGTPCTMHLLFPPEILFNFAEATRRGGANKNSSEIRKGIASCHLQNSNCLRNESHRDPPLQLYFDVYSFPYLYHMLIIRLPASGASNKSGFGMIGAVSLPGTKMFSQKRSIKCPSGLTW
jgi:hypothetical protein